MSFLQADSTFLPSLPLSSLGETIQRFVLRPLNMTEESAANTHVRNDDEPGTLLDFARMKQFIASDECLPYSELFPDRLRIFGTDHILKDLEDRMPALFDGYGFRPEIKSGGTLAPATKGQLRVMNSRPRIEMNPSYDRFVAILKFVSDNPETITVPKVQAYAERDFSFARELKETDKEIRKCVLKWFDPVTRSRREGYHEASVCWRQALAHIQGELNVINGKRYLKDLELKDALARRYEEMKQNNVQMAHPTGSVKAESLVEATVMWNQTIASLQKELHLIKAERAAKILELRNAIVDRDAEMTQLDPNFRGATDTDVYPPS